MPTRQPRGASSRCCAKRTQKRNRWRARDDPGILIFQMPVPVNDAPLERDLLRDQAYATIRDAIVDGTLAPGERLRDQELCAWLGLSRTPVREALSRLEQDGLVETEPQRYTRVTPLDRRARAGRVPGRRRAAPACRRARGAAPHGPPTAKPMRAANECFADALRGR